MTFPPNPRIQDPPRIRRDLRDLEGRVRVLTGRLSHPSPPSLAVIESCTSALHGVFVTLEELLPGLSALSLDRLSQDGEAQLEATFLQFRKLRGAVMSSLGALGVQAVGALQDGPGLFSTLLHAPVTPEPARFEGDWALPMDATLRAVLFVELPELELKNPPPGPRYLGGDHLTVAFQMRGDHQGLLRIATRFGYARGPSRASEIAQWFDGEVSAPLSEALSRLTLVAESLAHECGQTLRYQELNADREILLNVLERERPPWGEFVQA